MLIRNVVGVLVAVNLALLIPVLLAFASREHLALSAMIFGGAMLVASFLWWLEQD